MAHIYTMLSCQWHIEAEVGLWLTDTKMHFVKWITWCAKADDYGMFSFGWLQHSVNAFLIALHKHWVKLPCFSSHLFIFPHEFINSFRIPYVMIYSVSVPLSQSSLSYLHSISLMLNVIPPFFRLWFRWHLPRVAVIAKCRLGRWDIGQPPPPFHPFYPTFFPSLLSGMTIPQFVLNACWVL